MKGLSLKNKIIIFAVAILTALLCVGATLNENVKKTAYAATPIFTAKLSEEVTKSFSAKFGGDVLFSAEKVLVNAYAANGQLKTEDENKITIYYNAKKYTYDSNRDVYTAEGEEDYFEKDGDVYAYYKKVDEQAISCVFDGSTLKFKLDGADKYAKDAMETVRYSEEINNKLRKD